MTGKALVLATATDEESTTSTLTQGRKKLGEVTAISLRLYEPEKISYEDYLEMGRLFGVANRQLQWVIGDWLNLVEEIFPDRYSQAIEVTGLAKQTLMNRASICGRIPEERRREGLHFSVHAVVAYMEPRERERWLNATVKNDWDRETLVEHIRHEKQKKLSAVGEPAVTGAADNPKPGDPVPRSQHQHVCPSCGHAWEDDEE